jgi:hypothetical protein
MDKSKLPKMQPGKVVPTHGGPAKPKKGKKKGYGGLSGAIDAIKERKRRQQEALDL